MMLDVKEGQFAITQGRWGFSVVRADKVTPKLLKTHRHGSRYAQADRSEVIAVCDDRDSAAGLMDRLDAARRTLMEEKHRAEIAFKAATEPMRRDRDEAIARAKETFRQVVAALSDSVSGPEGENSRSEVEGEAPQSGGSEASASPKTTPDHTPREEHNA